MQEVHEGLYQIPYVCHWMISLELQLKTLGKSINGVGVFFSRTDTYDCISFMTSSSELTNIRSQRYRQDRRRVSCSKSRS